MKRSEEFNYVGLLDFINWVVCNGVASTQILAFLGGQFLTSFLHIFSFQNKASGGMLNVICLPYRAAKLDFCLHYSTLIYLISCSQRALWYYTYSYFGENFCTFWNVCLHPSLGGWKKSSFDYISPSAILARNAKNNFNLIFFKWKFIFV